MKNRNNIVDIEKFIAALVIMTLHRDVVLGFYADEYTFAGGWIFVELFLIITGYYTTRHFAQMSDGSVPKNNFIYTIRKFLPILPYVWVAVSIQWLAFIISQVHNGMYAIKDVIYVFMNNIIHGMLLINITGGGNPFVTSMWYLMALLVVLPIFNLVCCMKDRYSKITVAFLYCAIYYGTMGVEAIIDFPQNLLRVMAGLLLGCLIYEMADLAGGHIKNISEIIANIIAVAAFLLTVPVL